MNDHIVTVTGQVSPNSGIRLLRAVGVIGTIVPSNETVTDDISLGSGGGGDAEAAEAADDHQSRHQSRKQFLANRFRTIFHGKKISFHDFDTLRVSAPI
jgi:hypothetical protein